MAWQFEITDTFGGEANYSWVKRGWMADMPQFQETDGRTQRAIVRAAKRFAGWTGERCDVDSYGDGYRVTPRGRCVTMFVTWTEHEHVQGPQFNHRGMIVNN